MKIRYFIIFILAFISFQFFKFIKIRITNFDLPKGKIVFSSQIDGDDEVYIMNINGSSLKKLTHNTGTKTCTATDDEASFSKDGNKIIFRSSRGEKQNYKVITDDRGRPIGEEFSGGTFDIYMMFSNGKNQIPLTYNTISSRPFFTPDAKRVVFDTLIPNSRNLKRMININNKEERILNFGGGMVEFTPDGKKMFDNFEGDVSVSDVDGENKKRLTHFNDGRQPKLGIEFIISSDNKKMIVITSEIKKLFNFNNKYNYYDIFEFYLMDIDGSNVEMIHRIDTSDLDWIYGGNPSGAHSGQIWQCNFSPDNKNIIFYGDFYKEEGIYSLNLEDKTVVNLTGRKENWNGSVIPKFVFTPDGKRIIFMADIYPEDYYLQAVIIRNIKAIINSIIFKEDTPYYDNKYLCIMDIDGENFRKATKLPISSRLGRNFIHWIK